MLDFYRPPSQARIRITTPNQTNPSGSEAANPKTQPKIDALAVAVLNRTSWALKKPRGDETALVRKPAQIACEQCVVHP
jgi:hypothetical protein